MINEEVKKWLKDSNFNTMFDESMKEDVIDFKVGDIFYIREFLTKYKIHICGIIDDNQIVYKYYGKRKQWWHYFIKDRFELTWKIFLSQKREESE